LGALKSCCAVIWLLLPLVPRGAGFDIENVGFSPTNVKEEAMFC
jgi:hypothetical protein